MRTPVQKNNCSAKTTNQQSETRDLTKTQFVDSCNTQSECQFEGFSWDDSDLLWAGLAPQEHPSLPAACADQVNIHMDDFTFSPGSMSGLIHPQPGREEPDSAGVVDEDEMHCSNQCAEQVLSVRFPFLDVKVLDIFRDRMARLKTDDKTMLLLANRVHNMYMRNLGLQRLGFQEDQSGTMIDQWRLESLSQIRVVMKHVDRNTFDQHLDNSLIDAAFALVQIMLIQVCG